MKPSILFAITEDPRTSARPAEAVRIAAGIGSWKRTEVYLYLHEAAVLALSPHADEWIDGDHYIRYLPLIAQFGRPIYVPANEPSLAELHDSTVPFQPLSELEFAALTMKMTYVARF